MRSYWLRKMMLLECPKAAVSDHHLQLNVSKGPKHCWNLHDSTFKLRSTFMSDKVRCVSCLLVGSEMWGASFSTLTADDMYSYHNKEKFPEQAPTQLSSKPKSFSGTFNFYCLFGIWIRFCAFWRKRWSW